jgi:hypothetical protein
MRSVLREVGWNVIQPRASTNVQMIHCSQSRNKGGASGALAPGAVHVGEQN